MGIKLCAQGKDSKVIKACHPYSTGKSRNELAKCELAFLQFLDRHADNKENIPLSNFLEEWENVDSSDDENSCVEVCALRPFPFM